MAKKKMSKKKKRIIQIVLLSILILFSLAVLVLLIKFGPTYNKYKEFADECIKNSSESDFKLDESSYIYDAEGNELAKLKATTDSVYLSYDDIPQDAIDAFVAVEDTSFWSNPGYDIKGIIRVCYNYLKSDGEEVHGASTITQQLAKNIYLTSEVSLERKGKEILIARGLTKKYSKEQIIEFYINDIYYANGYYGIEAAANGYFGCSAKDLDLSQIAYICSIPNSPTYYDPYVNPDNALSRRDKILKDMKEQGYITASEYKTAVDEEIKVVKSTYEMKNYETTFAIDCAVKTLMENDGFDFKYHFDTDDEYTKYCNAYQEAYDTYRQKLYSGGYKVYTSINESMQATLQDAVDKQLAFDEETSDDGIYALQGAATVIDNETGNIVAIVGGRSQDDINTYTLNRAYQSFRQPGSTFKPLVVYAPALELGYNVNSTLQNISVDAAKKSNDVNSLTGSSMSLRKAVEQSKNGCAYQLFNKIGVDTGLAYVEGMKFQEIVPSDYSLSSSLGGLTYGVTTVEMTSAYASFVNDGIYRGATCITSMLDSDDNELYKECSELAYSKDASRDIIDVMKGVISSGTAKSMGLDSETEAAGKTGTTNDCKDGWFCGMTPYYTISVWVGYDTPRALDSLCGGTYPALIWKSAMETYIKDLPAKSFEVKETTSTGDEDYLPGRDDSEELSDGYTVGDYRSDYAIVDQVNGIVSQMEALDKNSPTYANDLQVLYTQGLQYVSSIYGNNATNKAQTALDEAYNRLKPVEQESVSTESSSVSSSSSEPAQTEPSSDISVGGTLTNTESSSSSEKTQSSSEGASVAE